ncbi:MAG: hypothetical protein ABI895_32615 [Deltaproteobacteria bacterium]
MATFVVLKRANRIDLPLYDATKPETVAAWRKASKEYAEGASGNVRVLQSESVGVKSTWAEVEYRALMDNPNIKSITAIDPASGVEGGGGTGSSIGGLGVGHGSGCFVSHFQRMLKMPPPWIFPSSRSLSSRPVSVWVFAFRIGGRWARRQRAIRTSTCWR